MKFLLLTPLLFLLSSPIKAEANNAKHEKCLQAADYEGCMDFESSSPSSSSFKSEKDCSKDYCLTDKISQKTDNLGMKIIKGWIFKENPAKREARYWDPYIYKINSGGTTGRFFHTRAIVRYFSKGRSGTSGYFSNSGSGTANCTQSLYGNINCTTTSPSTTYIPGTPGVAPQVKQIRIDIIYDCEDHTVSRYFENKFEKIKGLDGTKKRWQSIDNVGFSLRYSPFKYASNMTNLTCPNKGEDLEYVFASDLYEFIEKGIKKRGSSNKKNIGNINCDSPVWKNKPRCN